MHSSGRCPYCGYKGEYSGTIIDITERAYRLVRINPIWKFWKPQFKRVFKNEDNS
jgi:hypothetical protein